MPQLVVLLVLSFVLMLLSGIFFALGLPEDWARALFMATILIWTILGVALIVQGQMEVRALARVQSSAPAAPEPKEGKDASG